MLKLQLTKRLSFLLIFLSVACASHAQDAILDPESGTEEVQKTRVLRIEEPIPYWVEADQLRVRDTPVSGDVIGMLKIGQKVRARRSVDNWVLISSNDAPEKWVNKTYLSMSPVTWASYNFESRSARNLEDNRFSDARYDIKKKRIKVKNLKGVRVYAADIMRVSGDQKIVISRHDFPAGRYYEKRMVKCDSASPSHVKMLGEGYTVRMMEADPRRERVGVPMFDQDQIEADEVGILDRAIANFTCATDKL